MVLREMKLTRSQFDALPEGECEDLIAHYLAGLKIQAWQNYRDWLRLKTQGGK